MVSSCIKSAIRVLCRFSTGACGGDAITEYVALPYSYCYFKTNNAGGMTNRDRTSGSDRCVRNVPLPSVAPY